MLITTRKIQPDDNVTDIAKYIHQTDEYIYMFLFENYNDPEWINTISSCLTDPSNLFFYKNMIAVLDGNKIIGIANIVKCGMKHTFLNNNLCQSEAYRNYFIPLIDELEELNGNYLCNICIDSEYRNQGLGHYLLKEAIRLNPETMHTDALSDNLSAVKVYKDNGFVITEYYTGYSGKHPEGLECVKLIKE